MPNLVVNNVGLNFGGLVALDGVTFTVPHGELCSIVGPNGAGKSSLFNCITGLYRPSRGDITYGDQSLVGVRPHQVIAAGVARTFQNLAFIPQLSVLENVMLAGQAHQPFRPIASIVGAPWEVRSERALRAEAMSLLERFDLDTFAAERMGELTFGTQKRIELARALLAKPSLLLVDEPAGGLNGVEITELGSQLQSIQRDLGATVILVEHHMGLVMSISERVIALDGGVKIAEGTPSEVSADPVVISAYLGGAV